MKRFRFTSKIFQRAAAFLPALPLLIAGTSLGSCTRDDEPTPPVEEPAEHVTLLYAVNRSSLWRDYALDAAEINRALAEMDDRKGRFLVYCTDSTKSDCHLYEAVRNADGTYRLDGKVVKDYPHEVTSTHPDRISDVVEQALSLYPDAVYSLFFWGHGTSWTPSGDDHQLVAEKADVPQYHSYGGEYSGNFGDWKNTDSVDIDELAAAIPSGKFDYIWFDCCYMSGIETIYQFRDKCNTLVVYPTEVWEYGLPYDLVLPHVYSTTPDLKEGARVYFDYYNRSSDPVTATVIDMSAVEEVAEAVKGLLSVAEVTFPMNLKSSDEVDNYARSPLGPYYDFRAYLGKVAERGGCMEKLPALDAALDRMVIYHAESAVDFNRRRWMGPLSGISIHDYNPTAEDAPFYRSLDWFQRVFPTR